MTSPSPYPTAERIIACILAIFFACFGWVTLVQGGITLKGKRGVVSFVNGWPGVAVAGLAFLVAGFGVSLLLRSCKVGRSVHYIAWAIVLVPPVAYVVLHR